MPDVLIYADTLRSPELRHEVPLPVPDPFLYVEREGRRYAFSSSLETVRLGELEGIDARPYEEVGLDDLIARGVDREEQYLHLALSACRALGVTSARVPHTFPLELADHLRAGGIELIPDRRFFSARRRVKTEAELRGILRAQRAAEAAMDAVRGLLRRAEQDGSALSLEGQPLTCERLRRAVGEVLTERDAVADEIIVSHGPQTAIGHEMGFGVIAPGEPIVVDVFPRDRESGCYADMTRTFVVGQAPEELVVYHRLVQEALALALSQIRAGASARELYLAVCDLFEQAGYRTGRSKRPGEVLAEGFYHGLGHGVGLEVHEEPGMGLASTATLVAGDVVAVEPGLYRPGFGGCRLEDLVLVREDGCQRLTKYAYDLAP
ncbi:MAG: peptidase M24 [Thermoleophilia bacterium]